jgi:hypothetical protein
MAMTNLSLAARATYDAFNRVGFALEPSFETDRKALAAAIRIAADHLDHATSAHTLYAISDELEEIKYGTYRSPLPEYQSKN